VQLGVQQKAQTTLSAQLQKTLKFLQYSALELRQELALALESNALLEEVDPADEENLEEAEPPSDSLAESTTIETELIDLFEDYLSASNNNNEEDDFLANQAAAGHSWRDELILEAEIALPSMLQPCVFGLIQLIDELGFCPYQLPEIQQIFQEQKIDCSPTNIEKARAWLQTQEPLGIGCHDFSTFVALQLAALPKHTPIHNLAAQLCQPPYFEKLAEQQFQKLRQALGCSQKSLQQAYTLLQSLKPYPLEDLEENITAEIIIPDLILTFENQGWRIRLNEEAFPKIRLNTRYIQLLKQHNQKEYLKQQLQEARGILQSLSQRHDTLLKIAEAVIRYQEDFLLHGEKHLKPLILKDIAEELGFHESTISRATNNKYLLTPRGLLPLRRFFSNASGSNSEHAATAVQALIRQMIQQENPEKPLSDNQLVKNLAGNAIHIARRTVAKYREQLGIPPAHLRKRHGNDLPSKHP
jgi:RNA polymerase sigma-54 factor